MTRSKASTRRRPLLRSMISWSLVGLLLSVAFFAVLFKRPLQTQLDALLGRSPSAVSSVSATPTSSATSPSPASSVTASSSPTISASPTPIAGMLPVRKALESKLNALETSRLGSLTNTPTVPAYSIIDVGTGQVLAARQDTTPLILASNTKLLTSVALMHRFSGDETFTTRVVQPEPGQIILVGGGDPTLARVPATAEATLKVASTQELAQATASVLKAAGQTQVTLNYDASLFQDSGWAASWPSNYSDQVTRISALWVDEGKISGDRSNKPALAAAKIFAKQLETAGITVTGTPTEQHAQGEELARVVSPALRDVMEVAMQHSNNSYTEVLGFHLAAAVGKPTTFVGSAEAITEELQELGLWQAGATLHDASGLSRQNVVPTVMLAQAARKLAIEPKLRDVIEGLPTAGETGTLSERFTDPLAQPARGIARAKTGTLTGVSTLAGLTTTQDGRKVAFAFVLNGQEDALEAQKWIDQATGVLTACGCR